MYTIPNLLSLARIPLSFLFLLPDAHWRAFAIFAACLTDFLDGFIARRYNQTGRIGTILDPLTDKFFVFFVLFSFISENRISVGECLILISRDFSVMLYGIYLGVRGRLLDYQFRSIWCGKISTSLQFTVLLLLNFGILIPTYLYGVFLFLGILALGELYQTDKRRQVYLEG